MNKKSLFALAILANFPLTANAQSLQPSPTNDARIREIIREEIAKNPRLIVDTLNQYTQELRRSGQQLTPMALTRVADETGRAVSGKKNGLLFAVFNDYNCPYCKQFAKVVIRSLQQHPELRIVIIDYPILGPGSREAAAVATAAAMIDPEKAFALYKRIESEASGRIDKNAMLEAASAIGFDRETLNKASESPSIIKRIDETMELGRNLGIDGTPSFVLGTRLVRGSIPGEELETMIKQASTTSEGK